MAHYFVEEDTTTRAAHFMLNENITLVVPATEIGYTDGYVIAFEHNKPTAIFQPEKIVGCWMGHQ